MSSTLKNLLLLIAAALALMGGYWLAQKTRLEPETGPVSTYGGGQMINFTLSDLEGKPRSLDEWRGQVIVLNFWGTWCPPCREEIPLLIDIQKKRGPGGLQVVGVAIDDKAAVQRYRQSSGINYPLLMGTDDTLNLIARYGNPVGSLPYSVILDRQGGIIARKLGAFGKSELEKIVDPLLLSPSSKPAPSS